MAETLKSAFQNPRTEQSESGELKNVRIVADEKDSSLSRVYFGAGENDYLKVQGDEKDTRALADVIGKLAESERTVAKFADVPPEDRPTLHIEGCPPKVGGYYSPSLNIIVLDPKSMLDYDGAALLAHELQHFEQSRRTEWMGLKINTAEQIFVERIGESAADTAKYQYLYDVRNRPGIRGCWATGGEGYSAYLAAKEAGKPEGECVLDAMRGYAKILSVATLYAKHYHPALFQIAPYNLDERFDKDRLTRIFGEDLDAARKGVAVMARTGDKVDEAFYFRNLTTGMMSETPADEKIARELRAPEFDYVPQNAYDCMKYLEPVVEKCFPGERFLRDVNVGVEKQNGDNILPRREYDDRYGAAAKDRWRAENEKKQLDLMRKAAGYVRSDWAEINGWLHNLPCDVNRDAAVKKAAEDQKTANDIDPRCLAADNDGAALLRLYQTENKAYHLRIHQMHTQFKQDEAAYRTDLQEKRKDSFDKAAAADALEQKRETAKMIQGAVDDFVAAYPESMRKDVRAALQKEAETGKQAEMPAPKTFKDRIKVALNRKKIRQGRIVVENCFKQVEDKAVRAAAVAPAAFDKKVDAARRAAEQAENAASDAEKGRGALKADLNAECQKLRDAMFKSFESKAGQMLYARQRRDKEAQKPNAEKAPLSLQGRLNDAARKQPANNALQMQKNQRMRKGESR